MTKAVSSSIIIQSLNIMHYYLNYHIFCLIQKYYQANFGILLANIFLYIVSSIYEQFC